MRSRLSARSVRTAVRSKKGCLFLPLVGEKFDGHDYIGASLEAGAAACLTAVEPAQLKPGKAYIRVENTQDALRDLASWYRGQFPIPVVAVTGSVGKTTTKDMVAAVLGRSSMSSKRMATSITISACP